VRLTLGDYDSPGQVLLVRKTKFYKSRLVPLSADAIVEIDHYLLDRLQPCFPCDDDSPLLLHRHGALTGYSGMGLGDLLRKLFPTAGIRNRAGRSPRVHDLRFTFAVHALLRWYRAGVDVQARLPALSTYMGHASIQSTQYYLTFFDAITQTAGERFEEYCSHFLPTTSSTGGYQ
jgi:integrase